MQKIKKQACLRVSRCEKSKRWTAGIPARLKNKKMGLLELQQGQKIKKMGCWNSSKGKKSKRWAAGTPASQKIKKMACWNSSKAKNQKKMGLLELQQGQKSKKQGCWNSSKGKKSKRRAAGIPASQKMRQTLVRLPYDAIKQWCQRLRHHA